MAQRRSKKARAKRLARGNWLRALVHRALGLAPQDAPIGGAQSGDRSGLEMGLIGIDVASNRQPIVGRALLPLLIAGLLVALGVSAMRIDLLRIRYALAETVKEEQRLRGEERSLTVRMRTLRDPVQLAERAQQLGFVRPDRLIDLPGSAPGAPETPPDRATSLAVSDAVPPAGLVRP
jgi:hypothetical protein